MFYINGIDTHIDDAVKNISAIEFELTYRKYSPLTEGSLYTLDPSLLYNFSSARSVEQRERKYAARRRPGIGGVKDEIHDAIDSQRDNLDQVTDFVEATWLLNYEQNYVAGNWNPRDAEFAREEISAGTARELADKIDQWNNDWKDENACLSRQLSGGGSDPAQCNYDPVRHLNALNDALNAGEDILLIGYSEGSIYAELYRKMLINDRGNSDPGTAIKVRNVLLGTPVAKPAESSLSINHPGDPVGNLSKSDNWDRGGAIWEFKPEQVENHLFGAYLDPTNKKYDADVYDRVIRSILTQYTDSASSRATIDNEIRFYATQQNGPGNQYRILTVYHQPITSPNAPKRFGNNIAGREPLNKYYDDNADAPPMSGDSRTFSCRQIISYPRFMIGTHEFRFSSQNLESPISAVFDGGHDGNLYGKCTMVGMPAGWEDGCRRNDDGTTVRVVTSSYGYATSPGVIRIPLSLDEGVQEIDVNFDETKRILAKDRVQNRDLAPE